MSAVPFSYTLRDSKNQVAVQRLYADTDIEGSSLAAAAAAVAAAAAAASNGHLDGYTGAAATAPVAGTAATYNDVEDKCVVVLQTASGALHHFEIPAPKASCFLDDQETLKGDGPGQAYGSAIIAHCATRDGISFASVVGGNRARVKLQRRFNVRTRNPALTGQGL